MRKNILILVLVIAGLLVLLSNFVWALVVAPIREEPKITAIFKNKPLINKGIITENKDEEWPVSTVKEVKDFFESFENSILRIHKLPLEQETYGTFGKLIFTPFDAILNDPNLETLVKAGKVSWMLVGGFPKIGSSGIWTLILKIGDKQIILTEEFMNFNGSYTDMVRLFRIEITEPKPTPQNPKQTFTTAIDFDREITDRKSIIKGEVIYSYFDPNKKTVLGLFAKGETEPLDPNVWQLVPGQI